jgi:hypothetical protein
VATPFFSQQQPMKQSGPNRARQVNAASKAQTKVLFSPSPDSVGKGWHSNGIVGLGKKPPQVLAPACAATEVAAHTVIGIIKGKIFILALMHRIAALDQVIRRAIR